MIDSVTVSEVMPVVQLIANDGQLFQRRGDAVRHHHFEGPHLSNAIRRAARWMRSPRAIAKFPPRHILLAMVAFCKAQNRPFLELAKHMIVHPVGSAVVRLVMEQERTEDQG